MILAVSALAVLFTGSACEDRRDEMREINKTIPLQGATRAETTFKMAAGELILRGGAGENLMTGSFLFGRLRWEPRFDHRTSGDTGRLTVEQRRSGLAMGRVKNTWDIRLTEKVPLEVRFDLGAGKARIELNTLKVSRLNVQMGVGDLELDLSGTRAETLIGRIKGGIGHASIDLPAEIGVRVRVEGGLGSVQSRGLIKEDHFYRNEAYGKTSVSIDLEVEAGIGSIDLRLKGVKTISF